MKRLLLYLMAGALGIAGTTATYEFLKQESFPKAKQEMNQEQEIKQKKTLENITFEQAKLNPFLRQQYLDQILANKEKYSIPDWNWNSFEKLVYDHDFKKLNKEDELMKEHAEEKHPIDAVMCTPYYVKKKGQKQKTFVHEKSFSHSKIKCESEFLSLIDHESVHAFIHENQALPYSIPKDYPKPNPTSKESEELKSLIAEVVSYDVQFYFILKEKRKVNDEFKQQIEKEFLNYYEKLKRISKEENIDGNYAKFILTLLQHKPNK